VLEFVPAHPVGAAKECAGIRELDNADVELFEPLCVGSVTTVAEDTGAADSRTNLSGIILLSDVIERVGERERSTTHCVEFLIGHFTHFTHDYLLVPKCCRDVSNSNVRSVSQVPSTAPWVDNHNS
jgi:hypothetical protein